MTGFVHARWPLLHEDNHLLVVYKPAGLLSQGDASGADNLLDLCKSWLKTRHAKPGRVFLGLVHRLDRPVAGVMAFARTSKAAARLSAQIRERRVRKRCTASKPSPRAAAWWPLSSRPGASTRSESSSPTPDARSRATCATGPPARCPEARSRSLLASSSSSTPRGPSA